MKKFISLLIVCLALFMVKTPYSLADVSATFDATHTFYTTLKVFDSRIETVQSGNGFLISCDSEIADEIYAKIDKDKLQGESFCFQGEMIDVNEILHNLNASIIKEERVEDIVIVYAYTLKLENYLFVDSQKVNIHIAYNAAKVTVRTWLILGRY